MEKCLSPIWNDQIIFFENILNKNFTILNSNPHMSEASFLVSKEVIINLSLSLLRFYREEGILDKWEELNLKLTEYLETFSAEQKAQFYYERALFSLFKVDINGLKKNLQDWPVNISLPFWEAKRAGLLAEMGNQDEALKIISQSLKDIRAKLNLSPVLTEYSLVSEESYIMLLHRYIKNSDHLSDYGREANNDEISQIKRIFETRLIKEREQKNENKRIVLDVPESDQVDSPTEWDDFFKNRNSSSRSKWLELLYGIRNERRQSEEKEYHDRLSILKTYKCDPRNEVNSFERILESPPEIRKKITIKKRFDIGSQSKIRHFNPISSDILNAYSFLRFYEDSGIPVYLPTSFFSKKATAGAVARIAKYSSYWAVAIVLRLGDSDIVEEIFDRKSLVYKSVQEIDSIIDKYLISIQMAETEIAEGNSFTTNNLGMVLANVIPEVLSRLSVKCSNESRRKIFNFLIDIYNSKYRNKYKGINNLLKRLLNSFPVYERYKLIPKLLLIQIPENQNFIEESEFPNPFSYLNINIENIQEKTKLEIHFERINNLTEYMASSDPQKRKWASTTLTELNKLQLLTDEQKEAYAKALWIKTDKRYNLPEHTNFYEFAFLFLPHPPEVVPEQLIKNYIKKANFPIQSKSKEQGIPMTRGFVRLCHNILGANKYISFSSSELISLFDRMVEWWDLDKKFLVKDNKLSDDDIFKEFQGRFNMMVRVISHVIIPKIYLNNNIEQINKIQNLINELGEYGIPALLLETAFLQINYDDQIKVLLKIKKYLASTEIELIREGLDSVLLLIDIHDKTINLNEISLLIENIAQKVFWRHPSYLALTLNYLQIIVNKHYSTISQETIKLLLEGLEFIAAETKPEMTVFDFSDSLYIRLQAIGLAKILYQRYKENNEEIPEVLSVWERIGKSMTLPQKSRHVERPLR